MHVVFFNYYYYCQDTFSAGRNKVIIIIEEETVSILSRSKTADNNSGHTDQRTSYYIKEYWINEINQTIFETSSEKQELFEI